MVIAVYQELSIEWGFRFILSDIPVAFVMVEAQTKFVLHVFV